MFDDFIPGDRVTVAPGITGLLASNDCVIWTGALRATGYGHKLVNGKYKLVHRAVVELNSGKEIEEGLVVMHLCDNRRCINPEHLLVGTSKENTQDAIVKGRKDNKHKHLSRSYKLNAVQVLEIHEKSEKGYTNTRLAKEYEVSRDTIRRVLSFPKPPEDIIIVPPSLETRLDESDDKGCLIYQGFIHPGGYGYKRINGERPASVHRLALKEKLGRDLLSGMVACHSCDKPACINPEHLFEGTQIENIMDAVSKGRQTNPRLFSETEIRRIRRDYAGGKSQKKLALEYGVARNTIYQIVNYLTYKDID